MLQLGQLVNVSKFLFAEKFQQLLKKFQVKKLHFLSNYINTFQSTKNCSGRIRAAPDQSQGAQLVTLGLIFLALQ